MTRFRNPATAFLMRAALMAPLAMAGCKSSETGARETFAREFSCPEDRVEVRARKDLSFGDFMPGKKQEPPAEVKADPDRLAKWNADRKKGRSGFDNFDMVEAKGCGHEQIYGCKHPAADRGGIKTSEVACVKPPSPRE